MDFIELKHVAAREIALALGVPSMLLGILGELPVVRRAREKYNSTRS
jgi:phage portal protein BeeE